MGYASPNWLPDALARILHRVFRSTPGTDRRWAAPDPPLHNQANMKMDRSIEDNTQRRRRPSRKRRKILLRSLRPPRNTVFLLRAKPECEFAARRKKGRPTIWG